MCPSPSPSSSTFWTWRRSRSDCSGRQPNTQLQRVFGGQVLAQALVAAARTVAVTRVLHSLHAYFLLPGRTDIPIVYDVEAVRDGGSFSSGEWWPDKVAR